MGTFADQMRAFAEKTQVKLETVVRLTVLDLTRSVVDRSPVDRGQFRANWMPGLGYKSTATTDVVDKTGAVSISRMELAMNDWKPGQSIWLSNNLPYAYRLEYGWSDQAPAGMVRLEVQRFKDHVAKAVGEVQ